MGWVAQVPDIWDMCKYDIQHNASLGLPSTCGSRSLKLEGLKELHDHAATLASVVVAQEYGCNVQEVSVDIDLTPF